jgi:LacI family transcriptional regulator
MRELADGLGVSISVVSRVLSGQAAKYRISKTTEAAVIKAAKDNHFRPNQLAQGLRLRKTSTLGLVIPDLSVWFFSDVARHIEMNARTNGYSILLCDSQNDDAIEEESIDVLRNRMIDGLIISPVGGSGDSLTDLLKDGLPIAVVDRDFSNIDLPRVTSDNYRGAYDALNHLIDYGHREIAFLQGLPNVASNAERARGYKAALRDAEIPYKESLVHGFNYGQESGYASAKHMIARKQRPTAVLAASNMIALGALRAFAEEGLRVPQDMSIISFDENPYFPYLSTPMTTIAQDTPNLGRMAVELLLNQIKQDEGARISTVLLPTKLISRESVRKVRTRKEG